MFVRENACSCYTIHFVRAKIIQRTYFWLLSSIVISVLRFSHSLNIVQQCWNITIEKSCRNIFWIRLVIHKIFRVLFSQPLSLSLFFVSFWFFLCFPLYVQRELYGWVWNVVGWKSIFKQVALQWFHITFHTFPPKNGNLSQGLYTKFSSPVIHVFMFMRKPQNLTTFRVMCCTKTIWPDVRFILEK